MDVLTCAACNVVAAYVLVVVFTRVRQYWSPMFSDRQFRCSSTFSIIKLRENVRLERSGCRWKAEMLGRRLKKEFLKSLHEERR